MYHKVSIFIVVCFGISLASMTALNAQQACGTINRIAQIQINDYRIQAELAASEQEKSCGLAFRDALPEDHGMLFLFSNEQPLTFWMKDTRIPLSIAFLKEDGAIVNILEMQALDSNTLYRSVAPARYALEMRAKWFADHRVKPGDRVVFNLTPRQN
ncbi:MAG: DUF192 domain-containing protein [Methylococcales bacterium]